MLYNLLTYEKNMDYWRIFTNDMVNEVVFIDKVGLEDAIKYQDIKYEIIDGYYFDEGRNNKINKVIKHLFDIRKK